MEYLYIYIGFPGSSVGKESACGAGDSGSLGSEKSPGEGNDNHSSIIVWKISWTEEPGGLYSPWAAKVGHDLATKPPYIYPTFSSSIDGHLIASVSRQL